MKAQPVLFTSATVLVLTLACVTLGSEAGDLPASYEVQPTPTVMSFLQPSAEPTLDTTPVPIPAFEKSIILYGFGGGGSFCSQFAVPPAPAVIGGTTYPVEPPMDPTSPGTGNYPRGAELCITGAPVDQPIQVELVSPDGGITLSTQITLTQNPDYDFAFNVDLNGIPPGGNTGVSAYREDMNSPINVEMLLWWPGLLPGGTWQARVSWVGQSLLGEFQANTRSLPEISLYDPDYKGRLFPSVGAGIPYTCRMAQTSPPYIAVAENAQTNSTVHVLLYSVLADPDVGGERADLLLETDVHTDAEGNGSVELPSGGPLPAGKYFMLGVPDGVSAVSMDDGFQPNAFTFGSIANAMDCFIVP
jgi:hypothetical protein